MGVEALVALVVLSSVFPIAHLVESLKNHLRKKHPFPPDFKNARVVPIASAVDGQRQRIEGEIVFSESQPLIAPLSGRACAYYELTILEYERGMADKPGGWATRLFDWASQDFYLEDETGRALIHQDGPSVVLDIDMNLKPKVLQTPAFEQLIARLGPKARELVLYSGIKLAIKEGVLEPGERISVWGVGRWERDDARSDFRRAERHLRIDSQLSDGNLIITDKKVPRL